VSSNNAPAAIRGLPSDQDFEALHHAAGGIGVADCWTNCASYCCKTNHPDQQFSLMKCGSAGLVYPLAEYQFLERHGRLQAGARETTLHHTFVFNEERDLRLRFVTTICDLGGQCSEPAYRPLICKFYPFYPAPDLTEPAAPLTEFVTGSVIDQHWNELNAPHPCWIVREKHDVVTRQTEPAVALIAQHPYLSFYLGAAAIFVRHVAEGARRAGLPAPDADPRKFFAQWEVMYLSGRLIDKPALRSDLTVYHAALERRLGPFEL
jgi:hypothetical protein